MDLLGEFIHEIQDDWDHFFLSHQFPGPKKNTHGGVEPKIGGFKTPKMDGL